MSILKDFKTLCPPSLLYFSFSLIGLFIISLQNLFDSKKYVLGNFYSIVPSTFIIFVIKFIFIVFWTWILNLICKNNYQWLSWLLVLFPFIVFFIIIVILIQSNIMKSKNSKIVKQ
jgi:hypothetical protein